MYNSRYFLLMIGIMFYSWFILISFKEESGPLIISEEIIINYQMNEINKNYTKKEINRFLSKKR